MSADVIVNSDLALLPTEEIRARLSAALGRTAEGIAEMAACVHELESRGEDLSALRLAVLPYLRRVAAGQLLPEVVVTYAGSARLLAAVATIPVSDQRELLDRGTVPLVVSDSTGKIVTRNIDPRALSPRDISRVFGEGRVLDTVEQVQRAKPRKPAGRQYQVRVDPKTRTVRVGKSSVSIAALLTALSEASGGAGTILPEHVPSSERTHCPLTADEKERLRAMCRATKMEEMDFVRRAVLAWLI